MINIYMSLRNKSNSSNKFSSGSKSYNKRTSNGVAVYDTLVSSSPGSIPTDLSDLTDTTGILDSIGSSGPGGFSGVAAILSCAVTIQSGRGSTYYTTPGTTDPLNFPIQGVRSVGAVFKNSSGGAMLISNVINDGNSTYIGRVATYNTSGYGTIGTWKDLSTTSYSYTYQTGAFTSSNTAIFALIPADQIFICEALKPDTASKGFNAAGGATSWAMIRSIGNVDADQIKAASDGGTLSTLLSDNNISSTSIINL